MGDERHQRLKQLFHQAEPLPKEEQSRFLLEACPEVIEGRARTLDRLEARIGAVEKRLTDLEEHVLELRMLVTRILGRTHALDSRRGCQTRPE